MPSTRGSRAILLTLIGHSYGESMRVALISREYPPEVYGGAGVHVEFLVRELRGLVDGGVHFFGAHAAGPGEFLVRELRPLVDVDVHCFGAQRDEPGVYAYRPPQELAEANSALRTLG